MSFITIAGNIGVGKSTLTTLLAARLGWTPFHEGFADNPYLSDFYADMHRWSFHSQVFFLSQRLQQHHEMLTHEGSVIQDRSVYEDAAIFARNLMEQGQMTPQDWQTYLQLYETLSELLRPPHLVVYLQATVETLQRRIQMRGRAYEQAIDPAYLTQLNRLYEEWVARFSLCPVLTVNTDNLDFVHQESHLSQIVTRIEERLRGKDFLAL